MKEKLIAVFSECLSLDKDKISYDMTSENTPEWDSLALVTLVAAVERQFDVQLTFSELQRFTSFKEVYKLLSEKKGDADGEQW